MSKIEDKHRIDGRLLWRLLRSGMSVAQLVAFTLACLLGVTIMMVAVQFYQDVKPVFAGGDDSLAARDCLVVNRRVTSAGALLGDPAGFTPEDVDALRSQPWCRGVGAFEAANFAVMARIGLGNGRGLRTGFFFEAVDDRYLDVDPTTWGFDSVRRVVPVIIPRDYLSLYNFGYAASVGLPRISYGQASLLPLNFELVGNGNHDILEGRIVGFSGRLNTVVVPVEFMQWARERYGNGDTPQPTRLVVELNGAPDSRVEKYMEQQGLEVAGDKMSGTRAQTIMALVVTVVVVVGVIISALALTLLLLSILLLLQRNSQQVRDVMLLGYTPAMVASRYQRLMAACAVIAFVLACVVTVGVRLAYAPVLAEAGITTAWSAMPFVLGAVVLTALVIFNAVVVRRHITTILTSR